MSILRITPCLAALLLGGASASHTAAPPLRLVGVTRPSKVVPLSPATAGILESIAVTEGQMVEAGAEVFKLSTELLELEIERLRLGLAADTERRVAAVRLDEARANARRTEDLHRQKIATQKELQADRRQVALAQIQLDAARAGQQTRAIQLKEAQARLEQRIVRSPIRGYVSRRFREVGEAVEELAPVLEVVQRFPMWVEFASPLRLAPQLKPGAKVTLHVFEDPKRTAVAEVVFASAVADPASQTFTVRVEVTEELDWKTGLKVFADVSDR